MYMLLLCDTAPKSRVLTLVDVYTASTQCLKLLCDQFGLQPHNSSPRDSNMAEPTRYC